MEKAAEMLNTSIGHYREVYERVFGDFYPRYPCRLPVVDGSAGAQGLAYRR